MAAPTADIYKQSSYWWGALCLFVTIAIILSALAFEYIGGYAPCPLCLQQRYAYYVAIPVLFIALILLSAEQRRFTMALFFFTSMIFLANAAFGVYHAGAEWGFWAAPTTCGATSEPLAGAGGNLLNAIRNVNVVDCGRPALVILGLSLAGWNAIISTCISIGCLKAAFYTSEGA